MALTRNPLLLAYYVLASIALVNLLRDGPVFDESAFLETNIRQASISRNSPVAPNGPVRENKASTKESIGGNNIKALPSKLVFNTCTDLQKKVVRNQTQAYKTKKSLLGVLTQCPDSTNWLEDFYRHSSQQQHDNGDDFLAVNIGCNKGYDSLRLLRMGTREESIQKKPWEKAAFISGSFDAACNANDEADVPLPPNTVPRKGHVYCIEPMPTTILALQKASEMTNMEGKGLHIVQAAISSVSGTAKFPVTNRAGIENFGLGTKKDPSSHYYQDVPLMTLSDFGKKHMAQHHSNQNINVLLIDTEGYDFEVLKGAGEMLQHVEYLEFEFHSFGKWEGENLKDAIDMLQDKGFTCYWAGKKKLWRITGCWQNYFRHHQWSNVACAHNELKPELAMRMEQVFLETIRY